MAGPVKPNKDDPAPDAAAPDKAVPDKADPTERKEILTDAAPTAAGDAPAEDAATEPQPKTESKTETETPADEPATEKGAAATDEAPAPEHEPGPEPESSPTPATKTPAPAVIRRGPGFLPLVLGGVVAAGIGFGAARYIVPQGWPFGPAASETSSLKAQLADQQAALAKLHEGISAAQADARAARADATKQAPALDTVKVDLMQQLDTAKTALSAQLETNKTTLAALDKRLSMVEKRPLAGGGASNAALGAYERDVQALHDALKAESAKSADLSARVDKMSAEVGQQLVTAAKTAAAEKEKAATALRDASARTALAQLNVALNSGAGFADALDHLRKAGAQVPETLSGAAETGVPTLPALQRGYADAARAALAASIPGTMGTSVSGRIAAFLQAQTGARSLKPRNGTGPDAVLSRAEAALRKGDIAKAVTTLQGLPMNGQDAMAAWVQKAQARIDAMAAAGKIAGELGVR